ncbi:MCM2/3/5 family protein, partial [Toxoplasma gondii RUB]
LSLSLSLLLSLSLSLFFSLFFSLLSSLFFCLFFSLLSSLFFCLLFSLLSSLFFCLFSSLFSSLCFTNGSSGRRAAMEAGMREILSLYFPEEGVQNADLQAYVEEWKTFLYEHRRTLLKHCFAREETQGLLGQLRRRGRLASAPRWSSETLCSETGARTLLAVTLSSEEEAKQMEPQSRGDKPPGDASSFVSSDSVGSLVAVRGSVLRMYEPRPLVTKLPFLCARCGARIVRKCPEGKVTFPGPCPTPRCTSRHFLPQRRAAETVDWQKFSLQSEDGRVVLNGCKEMPSAASALSSGEAAQAEGDSRSSARERNGDHPEPEEKAANEVRRPPSVDCEASTECERNATLFFIWCSM